MMVGVRFGCCIAGVVMMLNSAQADSPIKVGGEPLDLNRLENRTDWQAQWIQDPLFEGLPVRNLLRKEKAPDHSGIEPTDPQNIHSLFRKEFRIQNRTIETARLFITADDVYKVYLNGAFVGLGPAPSFTYAYPYNGWDIKPFLHLGSDNCIGVHVYYQGLVNRVWASGDTCRGC